MTVRAVMIEIVLLQAWPAVLGHKQNSLQGAWRRKAEERKPAVVPQSIQRHLEARQRSQGGP